MIPIPLNIPQKLLPSQAFTGPGNTLGKPQTSLQVHFLQKLQAKPASLKLQHSFWSYSDKKKIEYQHWHGWHRHQIRSVQTLRLTTNTTTISEHIYAVSQQWRTNGDAGIVFIKYRHTRRRWGLISEWNDTRNRPDSQCSSSRHHRHSFISL